MLHHLIPREGRFFELFRQSADLIVEGAKEFRETLNDLSHLEQRIKRIKDIEHKADEVTHRTVEMLHKTFITPLDREDIHSLISRLDDILDYMEAASQRMLMYGITAVPQDAITLADICVASAERVREAVQGLENMQNRQMILKNCVEINRLENDADQVLRSAMARLFREEQDLRNLIKLKDIFEFLESVTDRCEDVANIIEGIVLEYA